MSATKYIIGVDGGLVSTGICVLSCDDSNFHLIHTEEITTHVKDSLEQRLYRIYVAIDRVCSAYPLLTTMGLEETYVNTNAKSSLKLAMVTGIILALSQKYKLQVKFMSATHIKKQITGGGHSKKEDIYNFVSKILKVPHNLSHHIYDAIAIGILAS